MKKSKAEEAFFRDFDNVQIQEVAQEPWERFLVRSLDYLYTEPIKPKEERK